MDCFAWKVDERSGYTNWYNLESCFFFLVTALFFLINTHFGFFQVSDYLAAQDSAKKRHLNIWRYGDITDDDANEFGVGKRKN